MRMPPRADSISSDSGTAVEADVAASLACPCFDFNAEATGDADDGDAALVAAPVTEEETDADAARSDLTSDSAALSEASTCSRRRRSASSSRRVESISRWRSRSSVWHRRPREMFKKTGIEQP